ncbi:cyclic peptide export ABC transporter [Paenibacillus psychroresistens]|uniref:Beta-lactamase n=1 Tax=Paenibacillus psychroresistens TaxID=1778678 RepID=A0A6B8RL17_9BACL|nr:cyclic peptide export ABC transporter [Paenibacillus psychroresistens]QGQ96116.1 cyclic peptide export ABC transporter [Paenibacillus psychroresistens]
MGNRLNRIVLLGMLIAFHVLLNTTPARAAESLTNQETPSKSNEERKGEIDRYIQNQLQRNQIPGLAVALVMDGAISYTKGYGFSDKATQSKVTSKTLFELGSVSKAYTALAVLKLQEEGKIKLDDPITQYIPSFHPTYNNKRATITIDQLLHHTSGIPFTTIGDFYPSSTDNALENTVDIWSEMSLESTPGSIYEYSTTNYTVLGLMIQYVSGVTYEQYIQDHILMPLGLKNTYVGKENAMQALMATGYKLGFLKPHKFDAPVFRANSPGGYIISSADDMVIWMEYQLGILASKAIKTELFTETHQNGSPVAPFYALGWYKDTMRNEVFHGGANPAFSSFVLLRPNEKTGIAVMANVSSEYTEVIARGLDSILNSKEPVNEPLAVNPLLAAIKQLDVFSYALIAVEIGLSIFIVILVVLAIRQINFKKRALIPIVRRLLILSVFAVLCIGLILAVYYIYQKATVMDLPISFVLIWGPTSFPMALYSSLLFLILMFSYVILTFLYPKLNDKQYFSLISLSVLGGFGNAAIIFCLIQALNSKEIFRKDLMLYFFLSMVVYVICQRFGRNKLIKITNHAVYERRKQIIHTIADASFEKLEKIEKGKIHTVLNNDTEVISNFAGMFIGVTVNMVTLIFCFVYLGLVSLSGLLLSIVAIFTAGGLYFYVGKEARKFMEKNRDVQDTFFKFIGDLIYGIKELQLNRKKRAHFTEDMTGSVREYRDTNVAGQSKFTSVIIIGELLFVMVLGTVVFLFPLLFKEISKAHLMEYAFVFLYMTGPVNGVLNAIPAVIQYRISWKRMNLILQEIENFSTDIPAEIVQFGRSLALRLEKVEYHYEMEGESSFALGPISFECHSGEIVFITGGNGSGKSTLAKLLTGLYTPQSGKVTINGIDVRPAQLSQLYSAIFNDFYLFKKLYGFQEKDYQEIADELLRVLDLDGKISIENAEFSTLNLSTGQRKRLALLISRLENKPLLLFDEWAADQDPEYRRFFYETLLPEMKQQGACIIAITHDDRYYHLADKVIKLEMGKIESIVENKPSIAV